MGDFKVRYTHMHGTWLIQYMMSCFKSLLLYCHDPFAINPEFVIFFFSESAY